MPLTVQRLASRLTFRQMQVFQAVYDARSYSKAGDLLGLTQPAVSSQIKQLEQALGNPVFEYIGRTLYTTPTGERLMAAVGVIFSELRTLQSDLAALEGRVAGELKVVAVSTAQYVVPYLLRAFLDRNPDVEVKLSVVNRATALERLANNADDLVIMGLVPEDRGLSSLPFLDNELVAVAPPTHPLATMPEQDISAETFLNSGLLLRESGSGSRLALEVFCQTRRLRLAPVMELGSNDGLKHAVIAGLGVAVLPKLSILQELTLGSLVALPISGFPLRRSWCVVYPQNKHLTPAAKAFLEYMESNMNEFSHLFESQQTMA